MRRTPRLLAAALALPLALAGCVPAAESVVDALASGDRAAVALVQRALAHYCRLPEAARLALRRHLATPAGPAVAVECTRPAAPGALR